MQDGKIVKYFSQYNKRALKPIKDTQIMAMALGLGDQIRFKWSCKKYVE